MLGDPMISKLKVLLHFRNYSIKTKLVITTMLIVVLSAGIISTVQLNQHLKVYETQTYNNKQQTIEQLGFNIETYFDDLYRLMLATFSNEFLMQILENHQPRTEFEKLEKCRNIEGFLDDIMITPRQDILSVYIIADDIYRGGKHVASVDPNVKYTEFDWYKQVMKSTDTVFVPAHLEELITNPKFTVFSFVKRINSLQNSEKCLGVIKVDANVNGLKTFCDKVNTGSNGALVIVDQNNRTQFSNITNKELIDKLIRQAPAETSSKLIQVGGRKYIYNKVIINHLGWSILAFNSTEQLDAMKRNTIYVTAFTVLLCFLLTTVIFLLFSAQFLKPLFSIINLMKEVQNGNLDVRFPEKRQDEIGYLGNSFNKMVQRINQDMETNSKLLTEVYQANLLQNKAKLAALQNQIKPHFIYNTLNMISMQIQCNRAASAVDNINRLCYLMRAMARVDTFITIENEITLLKAYLEIQANRYIDRLEFSFNISGDTLQKTIPALLLQPIVENCIVHGCEANPNKTTLSIYDCSQKDGLYIYVRDDALGIDEATLNLLKNKLNSIDCDHLSESVESDGGIGLVNINARIKLSYGAAYGLSIESKTGLGTTVIIHLP